MRYASIPVGKTVPAARGLAAAGLLLGLLAACTTTQKAKLQQSDLHCGLLGDETCALLKPGGEEQMSLRYVNPAADWRRYDKIMIEPVSYWGGEADKISPADQQAIVNFFNRKLNEELGRKFRIVTRPGPGVMKLQVALIDAEAATPGLRSVSMVVPQAHMLSNLSYLATGTFPFVGGAQVEARITDSATGRLLAAAADRRLGGGSFKTGFQWKYGDVENAMSLWAQQAAEKLSAWTAGTAQP
jgi:hypothetical protein